MKKVIGAISGIGMLLAVITPAMATDTCTNYTTGSKSWNLCIKANAKLGLVSTNNFGTDNQVVVSSTNTGGNTVKNNTVSGMGFFSKPTGNAVTNVSKDTTLNLSDVTLDQSSGTSGLTGVNSTTGYKSVNAVAVVDIKAAAVSTNNTGNVTQTVTASSNTGGNTVKNNTVSGGVSTGAAAVNVSSSTFMNGTTVVVKQ